MRRASALLLAGALAGGPAPATAETFGDSTTVVVVEVPVTVLRDGEPVRGLGRESFEILDGRRRRPITAFQAVDLSRLAAPASPAATVERIPLAARRHFLFLFDLSFSQPGAVAEARAGARQMVREGLHPSDLVAVATYAASQGVRLLHGFTSDRRQAELAIETFGLPQLIQPRGDPLGLIFGDLEGARESFGGRGVGNDAVIESLQDFARVMEGQGRRQAEQRIQTFNRSLADLARLLRAVPGAKHVVYLSEGFDTAPLFGTADRETQERMSQAVEAGRVWEVDSEERYGSSQGQNQLERTFEELRRAGCALQTVDIGGLRTTADAAHGSRRSEARERATLATREESLALMAESTGGHFVRHRNDLREALGEVLERTGTTYLLAFEPRDLKLDGKYHPLKVKLKDVPGARVVHRPGYYAPEPFADAAAETRRLATAALVVGGAPGGALDTAVLAFPLTPAAAGGTGHVPVVLEIGGVGLAAGDEGHVEAEIYAYALAEDGTVGGFLSHSLTLDPARVGPQLAAGGLKFFGHLDLAPGRYRLRSLVRNRRTGGYGLHAQALTVPAATGGGPWLQGPFFVEPPGQWLMVREELAPGAAAPFPFLAAGEPYLAAARPRLAAGASATVRLGAWGLGPGELAVTGRVLDADGGGAAGGRLAQPRDVGEADAGARRELEATFESGRLAAGEYRLEVTVSHPATGAEAVTSGPFVVTR